MSNDEWSIEVEGKYHSHDVVFLYRTLVQKYPSFLCGMTNFRTFLQIGPGMWFLNNSAKTSSPLVWNIIFGHSKKTHLGQTFPSLLSRVSGCCYGICDQFCN